MQEEALPSTRKRKLLQCPKCDKTVKDLNCHLISVHEVKDRDEGKKMRREISGSSRKDKRPLKTCPVCKKNVYSLDKHLPQVHPKEYPCDSVRFIEAEKHAREKLKRDKILVNAGRNEDAYDANVLKNQEFTVMSSSSSVIPSPLVTDACQSSKNSDIHVSEKCFFIIYSSIYPSVRSIYSFIHAFIHSFIYSFLRFRIALMPAPQNVLTPMLKLQ